MNLSCLDVLRLMASSVLVESINDVYFRRFNVTLKLRTADCTL